MTVLGQGHREKCWVIYVTKKRPSYGLHEKTVYIESKILSMEILSGYPQTTPCLLQYALFYLFYLLSFCQRRRRNTFTAYKFFFLLVGVLCWDWWYTCTIFRFTLESHGHRSRTRYISREHLFNIQETLDLGIKENIISTLFTKSAPMPIWSKSRNIHDRGTTSYHLMLLFWKVFFCCPVSLVIVDNQFKGYNKFNDVFCP